MYSELKNYFSMMNIEYFSTLSYTDCREINKSIADRENFVPKSVIIYLLPYYTGETVNISRYAASYDYHLAIREINEGAIKLLQERFPEASFKGYGDHSPIDERQAALISGLGIAGDNGLIINEKYGSYIFIGDIVTDIEPEELGAVAPMSILRCEGCGICKASCPTGILRGEGTDCLSAITQKKGALTEEEQQLMLDNNTVWGCDLCQIYCPHNLSAVKTPVEFFYVNRIDSLNREVLDSMDKEEFNRRAFAWRKRATVERNISIFEEKCK